MKQVIIYDLNSLPHGVTIEKVKEKFKKDNILFWDSKPFDNGIGNEPKLIRIY